MAAHARRASAVAAQAQASAMTPGASQSNVQSTAELVRKTQNSFRRADVAEIAAARLPRRAPGKAVSVPDGEAGKAGVVVAAAATG